MAQYRQPGNIDQKSDDTPLTQADRDAHEIIQKSLVEFTPDIPVLSEEGEDVPYKDRKDRHRFWLVDPLDGTKEFIKESGEFTVNIALIENKIPILGVIYCPAKGYTYFAEKGRGAWYTESTPENAEKIHSTSPDPETPRIVASRDHKGPVVQKLVDNCPGAQLTNAGSSIKFCLIAHGKADIYLRDVPTMEWDTGAAQIIVEEAGGTLKMLDGQPLTYNKSSLKNPEIITTGQNPLPWEKWIV